MDLEKFNKWMTLIANLGVVIGIIFLIIEIQQNTAVTRSAAEMEFTNMGVDTFMRVAESPEYAKVMLVGRENPEALSTVQKEQYKSRTVATFLFVGPKASTRSRIQ